MVTVSDGKSKPVPMRLHLSMEVLKLQREDLEVECLSIIVLSSISRMNDVQSSRRYGLLYRSPDVMKRVKDKNTF